MTTIYTIGNETGVKSMSFVKSFKNSYLAKRFAKRNVSQFLIIEDNVIIKSSMPWLEGKVITIDAIKALNYLSSVFSVNAENIEKCVLALNEVAKNKTARELAGKILERFETCIERTYSKYTFNKGVNAGVWGFEGEITNTCVKGIVNDPAKGLINVNHKVYKINGCLYTCEALNGAITK